MIKKDFKKLKEKRISNTLKFLEKVKEIIDIYAEEIVKLNNFILEQEGSFSTKENLNKYLDIIFKCFEDIYKETLTFIKDTYNIEIKQKNISWKDIEELVYKKDGLTLPERITKHLQEYDKERPTKERMLYDMLKIINTESLYFTNALIKNKVEFEYAMVEGSGDCCDICLDWIAAGIIPADEFEEPPYHPECECMAIGFFEDEVEIDDENEDEIEDEI